MRPRAGFVNASGIIVVPEPAPCSINRKKQMIDEKKIADLGEKIAREFQPERIILFGSYAYGKPRPDSDVDLLVVLAFDGKGFRKSLEILNRVDPDFSVDLVARRPEDTARRYEEGDPLIREALDRGKVLYERHR
jgi:predicted nucleotidyltransferase